MLTRRKRSPCGTFNLFSLLPPINKVKMEQNLQPEAPPAPPVAATANELVRSSLPVEKPEDGSIANGECTAWTNEKCDLYLDRLEASFLDQFHRFKRLHTFCSEQSSWDPNTSLKLPSKTCQTSGQFKVLRDGRWQKINFKRKLPSVDVAPVSCDVLNSPWIRHFKHSGKCCTNISALQSYTRGEMQLRMARNFPHGSGGHIIAGDFAEVSDQNFVDGGQLETHSTESMATEFMTAGADVSTKNQIVPPGKY